MCRNNTGNKNTKVIKKNGRIIFPSNFQVCDSKKSRFFKEQKANGLLSNLVTRTSLIQIPSLGRILFYEFIYCINWMLLSYNKRHVRLQESTQNKRPVIDTIISCKNRGTMMTYYIT